jgi:hypothetical protein
MLYFNRFLPVIRGNLRMLWGGFRWQRTKEWFLYGDITPAMVLDPDRGLVAAYTDLAQDSQYRFLVVKIFAEKLRFIKAGVSRGQKYAAVALYTSDSNSAKTGKWHSFHPIVVDCISTNPALCVATKAKIPDSDWTALEIGLAQIADQSKIGIYNITLPNRVQN